MKELVWYRGSESCETFGMRCFVVALAVLVAVNSTRTVTAQAAPVAPPTSTLPEGINDTFLSDDLEPEEWINRWEVESREIYAARKAIVQALGLAPGSHVADIGCGTGLFVPLMADAVTKNGKVYAVDIAPKFIDFVRQRMDQAEWPQVEVVQCEVDNVKLPNGSIDVALVCDAYHHFEFPQESLQSIRFALRPGGHLFVIDFDRVPGVSREWIIEHVRAGKEDFRKEIEQAGFVFEEEIEVDKLHENYMLRFRRP